MSSEGIQVLVIEGISPSGQKVTTRMQSILSINGQDFQEILEGKKLDVHERLSALEAEHTTLALAQDSLYQLILELQEQLPGSQPTQDNKEQ